MTTASPELGLNGLTLSSDILSTNINPNRDLHHVGPCLPGAARTYCHCDYDDNDNDDEDEDEDDDDLLLC